MSLKNTLQGALAARGWTEAHLSAALHDRGVTVTPAAISVWLRGTSEPRLDTARAVADVLGMTLDELVPSSVAAGAAR